MLIVMRVRGKAMIVHPGRDRVLSQVADEGRQFHCLTA